MRSFLVALFLLAASTASAAEVGIVSTFSDRNVACPPYRINPYKVWGVAHKTLPCGTMLKITNLWSRKKITVTAPVVDIGPCTSAYCNTKMPKRVRERKLDALPRVAAALGSNGLFKAKIEVEDNDE